MAIIYTFLNGICFNIVLLLFYIILDFSGVDWMNVRQKLVQQQFLNNEEGVIKRLTQVYTQASNDINQNIADLMARSDANSSSVGFIKSIIRRQYRSK